MVLLAVLLCQGRQGWGRKSTAARVSSRKAEQGEFMAHHSNCSDCCRPQPQCGLRLPSDFSLISFSVSAAKKNQVWLSFSFPLAKPKQNFLLAAAVGCQGLGKALFSVSGSSTQVLGAEHSQGTCVGSWGHQRGLASVFLLFRVAQGLAPDFYQLGVEKHENTIPHLILSLLLRRQHPKDPNSSLKE